MRQACAAEADPLLTLLHVAVAWNAEEHPPGLPQGCLIAAVNPAVDPAGCHVACHHRHSFWCGVAADRWHLHRRQQGCPRPLPRHVRV